MKAPDYQRLFREQLAKAAVQLKRGAANQDSEALHSTRIALRRSREYLNLLPLSKVRRNLVNSRLKACMRKTSSARDADSYLNYLKHVHVRGAAPIISNLQCQRELSYQKLKSVTRQLSSIVRSAATLRKTPLSQPKSGAEAAATLNDEIKRLKQKILGKLRKISRCRDEAKLHRLRIAVKRLRYLTEIPQAQLRDHRQLKQLRAIQRVLGDLHDIQMLQRHLDRADFSVSEEVRKVLKTDAKRLFKEFKQFVRSSRFRRTFKKT